MTRTSQEIVEAFKALPIELGGDDSRFVIVGEVERNELLDLIDRQQEEIASERTSRRQAWAENETLKNEILGMDHAFDTLETLRRRATASHDQLLDRLTQVEAESARRLQEIDDLKFYLEGWKQDGLVADAENEALNSKCKQLTREKAVLTEALSDIANISGAAVQMGARSPVEELRRVQDFACAALAPRQADALVGPEATPTTWQPIATAPTDREVFFWVHPKTAEEAFVDTNGRPIVSHHAPRLHRGFIRSWSAMETATDWMELPDPPIGARE